MNIIAEGGTDVGKKRGHNEDSFGVFREIGLYMVADGMGGHAAGEVASQAAVDTMNGFITSTAGEEDITWPFERDSGMDRASNRLMVGIRLANKAIFDRAQSSSSLKGMGTTVVAALSDKDNLYIAHVGDSRAYRLSGGVLRRLSMDHSYVEEQVQAGLITPAQARTHPLRNMVTRALGVREDVKIDIDSHLMVRGDVYLLCSDGLSGMLTDDEVARIIASCQDDLKSCVERLIKAANDKGGDDNITAVLLKVA